MPLIEQPSCTERVDVRIRMSADLRATMLEYCRWAGFENNTNHFICEAIEFLLSRDKEWQKYQSNLVQSS